MSSDGIIEKPIRKILSRFFKDEIVEKADCMAIVNHAFKKRSASDRAAKGTKFLRAAAEMIIRDVPPTTLYKISTPWPLADVYFATKEERNKAYEDLSLIETEIGFDTLGFSKTDDVFSGAFNSMGVRMAFADDLRESALFMCKQFIRDNNEVTAFSVVCTTDFGSVCALFRTEDAARALIKDATEKMKKMDSDLKPFFDGIEEVELKEFSAQHVAAFRELRSRQFFFDQLEKHLDLLREFN